MPRSNADRWLFALKPASWGKLLVPAVLGQAIGLDATGAVSLGGLLAGALFVALDLAFVVLLNDWGDRDVDAIKRAMFPRSSEKTIPDGVLSSRALLLGGMLAGVAALLVALVTERSLGRPGFFWMAAGALALFVAYTLPPLRLNYRGGGELLEAIGVGVVLPWIEAYAQSGDAMPRGLRALPGFALLAFASAIASGLSDERSDRSGGKRTFTTMIGNALARRAIEMLVVLGGATWLVTAALSETRVERVAYVLGAAIVLGGWRAIRRASPAALTDEFDAQRAYKAALHSAVRDGALGVAAILAFGVLTGA